MDITTRVYFSIEGSGNKAYGMKDITCAKNTDDINDWNLESDLGLKTTERLLREIQSFCKDLPENPICGNQSYRITIKRNVRFFTPGMRNDCYGQNETDHFSFIFSKSNNLLYSSDLFQNFEHVLVENIFSKRDGQQWKEVKVKDLNSYSPLWAEQADSKDTVYVSFIPSKQIVVNSKLQEIFPRVTGRIPEALINLLKRKTEIVTQVNMHGIQR
ncbi:MAG: hypothetical protein J6W40_03655 [Alphaproteobacteria bacterium]|nr:hypothetical protein [Alphaproteobacteria bacterium]